MVYDYLITLKKPDYRPIDQVSQFMYLFALVLFSYYYYHFPKSGAAYLYFGAGILLAWIYAIVKKRMKGHAFFRFGLLIGAAGWLVGSQTNILMGILYAIAGLLEKQVKFPKEIGFSESEISFNTFPRKVLQWNEINNALIKDGLITIDLKNNNLFQKEIDGHVSADIEKEFNDFCKQHINAFNNNDKVVDLNS